MVQASALCRITLNPSMRDWPYLIGGKSPRSRYPALRISADSSASTWCTCARLRGGLPRTLPVGICSGGRTRTPNNRARTCRVADYTTPEWASLRLADLREAAPVRYRAVSLRSTDRVQPLQMGVADHAPDRYRSGLFHEVGKRRPTLDGRVRRWHGLRLQPEA